MVCARRVMYGQLSELLKLTVRGRVTRLIAFGAGHDGEQADIVLDTLRHERRNNHTNHSFDEYIRASILYYKGLNQPNILEIILSQECYDSIRFMKAQIMLQPTLYHSPR
jgi:hypothetical protein